MNPRAISLLVLSLIFVSVGSFAAHDVKIVPIDDDFLLPIVTADVHISGPSEVDFGTVILEDIVSRTLSVENPSGKVQKVTIGVVGQGGVVSLSVADQAFDLAPGGVRDLVLTYSPVAIEDSLDSFLEVSATDPKNYSQSLEVELFGVARYPNLDLSLSPVTLGFAIDVGAEDTRTFTLTNNSEADAEINGEILGFAKVVGSDSCWWDLCLDREFFTLAGGASMVITAVFSPSHEWNSEHTFTFSGTGPYGRSVEEELQVDVVAEDVEGELDDVVVNARLELDTNRHDFGLTLIGKGDSGTIRLTNTGTAGVTNAPILGLDPGSHCVVLDKEGGGICLFNGAFELRSITLDAQEFMDIRLEYRPNEQTFSFIRTLHFTGGAEAMSLTLTGRASEFPSGGPKGEGGLTPIPVDTGLRGSVNANTFLSSTGIDHVNTMTGNLMITLPIGQPFRIGPSFSHGLNLVYNSSVWDSWTDRRDGVPANEWGNPINGARSAPAYGSNAGLGWKLSLGELYATGYTPSDFSPHDDSRYWPNKSPGWLYVAPDGSRIDLGTTKSSMRLTVAEDALLEFPDGSSRTFEKNHDPSCELSDGCWRLTKITDSFGNLATIGYPGFSTGSATPSIVITYPYGDTARQVTIFLNEQQASGTSGGTRESGDLKLVVDKVTVPKFGGGLATYDFTYSNVDLVRGCPSDHKNADNVYRKMTVPLLESLTFPNSADVYQFAYNTDEDTAIGVAENCDTMAGTMKTVTLPTQAEIAYDWTLYEQPALCRQEEVPYETSTTTGVSARTLFNSVGDEQGFSLYSQRLLNRGEWIHPSSNGIRCERSQVSVTEVAHGPNVGSKTSPRYKVERFYHSMAFIGDMAEEWIREVHGLPVNRFSSKPLKGFSGEVWLSSETADCPQAAWADEDGEEGRKKCTIHKKNYKHFKWLKGATGSPWVDNEASRRRREVVDLEREEFGPNGNKWIETKYEDYDRQGRFRTTLTLSNFRTDGTDYDSTSETTLYINPNQTDSEDFGFGDDIFPKASERWLLGLYSKKTSNTTDINRIQEFEFDPGTGFLECQRTWRTHLGREPSDVGVRYSKDSLGFLSSERTGGGDEQAFGDGICPDLHEYGTKFGYKNGEVYWAQPLKPDGSFHGRRSFFREIDAGTGLTSAACDYGTASPLCEKYEYDLLGRRVKIDRGYKLNGSDVVPKSDKLVDTDFTIKSKGGGLYKAILDPSGDATSVAFTFDGLGHEKRAEWSSSAGLVAQKTKTHGMGFKWFEITPGSAAHLENCKKKTVCRTVYKHDIHGRVTEIKAPILNRDDAPYFEGAREITSYLRGEGELHFEIEKNDVGKKKKSRTFDHLGRTRKRVDIDDSNVVRKTEVDYDGAWTETTRTEGESGPSQVRKIRIDGRGFLAKEQHPEWNNEKATYSYDSKGNVTKEVLPGATVLSYQRDARGRVDYVYKGTNHSEKVRDFAYDDVTGQLAQAVRWNSCEEGGCEPLKVAYDWCNVSSIQVTENFLVYDTNGFLTEKETVVDVLGANGYCNTLYKVTQTWIYDNQGRVKEASFPICNGDISIGCNGFFNNGAPAGHGSLHYDYDRGDLTDIKLSAVGSTTKSSLIGQSYHHNGALKTVSHWTGGANASWFDVLDTADSGLPLFKGIKVSRSDSGSNPIWESGEHLYDRRTQLRRIYKSVDGVELNYDKLDRLSSYKKGGLTQRDYVYDTFDNLKQVDGRDPGDSDWANVFTVAGGSNRVTHADIDGDSRSTVYDARGHITQYGTNTFEWDPTGLLRYYKNNENGFQALNIYNASGQRVAVMEDYSGSDTRLLFMARGPSGKVMREFRFASVSSPTYAYKDYIWAGSQLRAYRGTGDDSMMHVHLDHLGTPRVVTQGNSQYLAEVDDDPYGNPLAGGGVRGLRIGFTGHEMDRNGPEPGVDEESLSYNFGARSYVPELGRFVSPDPGRDSSSWSLYGYAGNSPMMMVDPTGLASEVSGNGEPDTSEQEEDNDDEKITWEDLTAQEKNLILRMAKANRALDRTKPDSGDFTARSPVLATALLETIFNLPVEVLASDRVTHGNVLKGLVGLASFTSSFSGPGFRIVTTGARSAAANHILGTAFKTSRISATSSRFGARFQIQGTCSGGRCARFITQGDAVFLNSLDDVATLELRLAELLTAGGLGGLSSSSMD